MKKYLLLAACLMAAVTCSPVQQDVPGGEGEDKPDNSVPAGPLPKALVISASVDGKKIPSGGSAAKPVGTVWMAWATPKGTFAECFHLGKLREQITDRACLKALVGLLKIIHQQA